MVDDRIANRAVIFERCKRLGVVFAVHESSAKMRFVAWFQKAFLGQPLFAQSVWVTQYPHIFHPADVTDVFEHWQLITHELVHWQRQRDKGLASWNLCYLASKTFRGKEERLAYLEDIRTGRHTAESAAEEICGPLYKLGWDVDETRDWLEAHL